MNVSRCFDSEFYAKACEMAKEGSTIVTFAEVASSIRKLSEIIGVNFEECESKPAEEHFEKELVSDVQLAPRPTQETFDLIKGMGMPYEEVAGRLL